MTWFDVIAVTSIHLSVVVFNLMMLGKREWRLAMLGLWFWALWYGNCLYSKWQRARAGSQREVICRLPRHPRVVFARRSRRPF
jgi:hypothetical protein